MIQQNILDTIHDWLSNTFSGVSVHIEPTTPILSPAFAIFYESTELEETAEGKYRSISHFSIYCVFSNFSDAIGKANTIAERIPEIENILGLPIFVRRIEKRAQEEGEPVFVCVVFIDVVHFDLTTS